MAFKDVTTRGPIEWAKITEETRDMSGYEDEYAECEGAYTLNQRLTKEEFEKLKQAGSQKKPMQKRLLEGELVLKFIRKHKVTNKEGNVVAKAGGAPIILNADGSKYDEEKDGKIGNGTVADVTNLISTFKGQDGKIYGRTTLKKIQIVEMVPYEPDAAADDDVGF